MARRRGGDQSPARGSVSNRRHGAPAPPSPSMRAARRSRAAWLRCRAPPVDRQHPAGLDTARRRPARPGSPPHRSADLPPSRHRPARIPRIVAARAPVARSARLRPVRSALSRLSAAHRRSVRCDLALNPGPGGPCRCLSGPLAAAQAARQPPAPTRQGPPAPPPRPPAQFPAGAGTRAHTYAPRVRRGNFQKKIRERGGAPCKPIVRSWG